jgi:hypothetical protein
MTKPIFSFLLLLFGLLPLVGQSVHPPVEEVNVKFYNPPATGYQVTLPLAEEAVQAGIRAHMQPHATEPLSFSNHLVYETILYSPLTDAEEVTLHFQWRKVEAGTEIILVALMGDKESISPSAQPALSRVLLQDYSALARSLSGEPLAYDHLLAEPVAAIASPKQKQEAEAAHALALEQLQAYEDTIRILKEGVYSYEKLLEEQQAFIDTLLIAVSGEKGSTLRKKSKQMANAGRYAILEDSLQLMRDQALLQARLLERQRLRTDSLERVVAALDGQPSRKRPGVAASRPEQLGQEELLTQEILRAKRDSIARYYRENLALLNEQMMRQVKKVNLLRRELAAREAARRELSERLELAEHKLTEQQLQPGSRNRARRSELNALVAQNRVLRDSLTRQENRFFEKESVQKSQIQELTLRLQALETQHHETLAELNEKLQLEKARQSQLTSQLNEQGSQVASLNLRLTDQMKEEAQAQASLRAADQQMTDRQLESQVQLKQMEDQVAEARRQAQEASQSKAVLEDQLARTREDLRATASSLSQTEQSLEQTRETNQNLKVARDRYKQEVAELSFIRDSLFRLYERERRRSQRLAIAQDSLEGEIALLSPYTESARTRRRVYQQQLANLTELQRRLPQLEQALYAWEKRLDQREKYLREQGGEMDSYESMLNRIQELERENQQLQEVIGEKIALPSPSREFYSGNAQRGGKVVPAMCLDSELSALAIRSKIADYFREKKMALLTEQPLTFVPLRETSIDDQPVKLSFDVSDQLSSGWRRISCTLQFSDGSYFSSSGGNEEQRRAVQRLLAEILQP